MNTNNRKFTTQRGYALATSLLFLVVMAMLAVSMYGNVNVQEQMASNVRIKNRTLVAAKSALQDKWTSEVLRDHMLEQENREVIDVGDEYDTSNGGTTIDLEGVVSICYMGERECVGCSLDASEITDQAGFTYKTFFAATHVEEAATRSSTTIEQSGYLLMRKSDHVPNCNGNESDLVIEDNRVNVPSIAVKPSKN